MNPITQRIAEIEERLGTASWRVGSKVGRTIYKGHGPDDLIGVMDTRELAASVVFARNDARWLCAELKKARAMLRRLEWEGHVSFGVAGEGAPGCAVCQSAAEHYDDSEPERTHKPGCELAALLGGEE